MNFRTIDHEKLNRLNDFIFMLNKESENGSVIVVEGKRDARALTKAGFNGNLSVFNHFRGVTDFVDSHLLTKKKIILLFDMDRTGKQLTRKLLSQLQYRGGNVSLLYKKKMAGIDNGKIRHVEDLSSYAPYLSGITGSRPDLYFYT